MILGKLSANLIDFCYPRICKACGDRSDAAFCGQCEAEIDQLAAAAACELCGYPLVHATDPCPHCNGKGIDPIEQVVRLGVFNEPLKTLVHRMKYRHGWPIAEVLAERVMVHPPVKALLADSDCLVPLPLHPRRQWERGYNQAEVIARRLSWRTRLPVRSPLVRVRNSPSQTTLHAQAKRWENVRDVFRLIDAAAVGGRRVVLVDDVMTSGSTLRAAALALAAAKPARISVLTIAVADPKGRAYQAF